MDSIRKVGIGQLIKRCGDWAPLLQEPSLGDFYLAFLEHGLG
jgi:hypothetical protein